LKVKYYIRYADDFVFMSADKEYLKNLIIPIKKFLGEELKLEAHPKKIFIKTISSGVDFLGWIIFPGHKILRRVTRRLMFKKLEKNCYQEESLSSYLGMISHGNTGKIKLNILNLKSTKNFPPTKNSLF